MHVAVLYNTYIAFHPANLTRKEEKKILVLLNATVSTRHWLNNWGKKFLVLIKGTSTQSEFIVGRKD